MHRLRRREIKAAARAAAVSPALPVAHVHWSGAFEEARVQELRVCVRRLLTNSKFARVTLSVPENEICALPEDITAMFSLEIRRVTVPSKSAQ